MLWAGVFLGLLGPVVSDSDQDFLLAPPVVPGQSFGLSPGEHALRYVALWDLELSVQVETLEGDPVPVPVTITTSPGEAVDQDPDPNRLHVTLAAGTLAQIHIHVPGDQKATLKALESPDVQAWAASQRRFPPTVPSSELRQVLERAEALYQQAEAALRDDPETTRQRVSEALDLLAEPADAVGSLEVASLRGRFLSLTDATGAVQLRADIWDHQIAFETRTRPVLDLGHLQSLVNATNRMRESQRLDRAWELGLRASGLLQRTRPADDAFVLWGRMNLVLVQAERAGWLTTVRELERLATAMERVTLPQPSSPEAEAWLGSLRAALWTNLGRARSNQQDVAGSVQLFERALRAYETNPDNRFGLLMGRVNLAAARASQGDISGARPDLEASLEFCRKRLPDDHPITISAEIALLECLDAVGEFDGAVAAREALIRRLEGSRAPDHPALLVERAAYCGSLSSAGHHEEAIAAWQQLLADTDSRLRADHPERARLRVGMAKAWARAGQPQRAWETFEPIASRVYEVYPNGHSNRIIARELELLLAADLGLDALRPRAERLLEDLEERIRSALVGRSSRESAAILETERKHLAVLLSLALDRRDWSGFSTQVFELAETLRSRARRGPRLTRIAPEDPLLREVLEARAELGDVIAGVFSGRAEREDLEVRLHRAQDRRDRAERAWVQSQTGTDAIESVELKKLQASLPEEGVLIVLRRFPRRYFGDDPRRTGTSEDHLVAFLVAPLVALTPVELGPFAPIGAAIDAWRSAIDAQREASRALDVAPIGVSSEVGDLEMQGRELVSRVLEPLLAVDIVRDASQWILCLDGSLALVPWDALPLADGRRVGDRHRLRARLALDEAGLAERAFAKGSLLVVGGVDYEAQPVLAAESLVAEESAGAPPLALARGAAAFASLSGTRAEAEAVARLYEESLGRSAVKLLGGEATKTELARRATEASVLHIATHGYFVGDDIARTVGTVSVGLSLSEKIIGLAPMTLCGLALAGANRGADAAGRVAGILTAEELASWDLRRCELAVLSACDTSLGVSQDGAGVQSLQAALHAAGVRTAITSLWKVDDAATTELMSELYRRLWEEQLSVPEALWEAKRALRESGHPESHWAGWVVSESGR